MASGTSSSASSSSGAQQPPSPDPSWDEHYCDERDAAYLYRELAAIEPNGERRQLFDRLARVEDRHVERWEQLFRESGRSLPEYRTALRARMLAWAARHIGINLILPLLLAEEGREVQAYLGLARQSSDRAMHSAAVDIAADSAMHARELSAAMGREGEPWHVGGSGGYLRSVVYGFNDGLTANFGLVAGVIGAAVESRVVMLSGIAGMLADALSMGSSGYLAAKSEQEIYAHEIAMEREEIRLMPEIEEQELAAIYEGKGLGAERARQMARDIMTSSPEDALDEKVRVELGIGEPHTTPLREGLITGSATAVGAFIPVAPFLLLEGPSAVWVSFAAAMLFHFAVGAMRSLFTGRGVLRSGVDMFAVGLGVAAIGYLVGDLVVRWL
jgi:VIT1/CCC1 family predicted Fe2+/Mn2+ transporter/rubrerythrin